MKTLKSLIYGNFIRGKNLVGKTPAADIDNIVKEFVTDKTTESDIVDKINDLLYTNKFSKFDVYDFRKTIDKLSDTILQEKLVYSSVMSTLLDTGITKADIIQSVFYYCGMLSDFIGSIKKHSDNLVSANTKLTETQINDLTKQKEDNKKLIDKLLLQNNEIDYTIVMIKNTSDKYISDITKVKGLSISNVTSYVNTLKQEKDRCLKHLS